jgi:[acyl-carrier-protein] S-malonyltransferase
MGKELFDNYPVAREIFEAVDEAIGAKLSDIIFNGPMEELTLTANVQPAIFATSMAMLRVAEHKGLVPNPAFVAGHSLGEYTALCAAGALSVFDTAKLLRLRGESMQRAVPVGQGAMAVIMGLEIDQVREICALAEHGEICDIANDNAPGQIVISGNKPAIERAMELATNAGAKRAMLLPLSVPPHSRLMSPVADEMHNALYKIDMKAPSVPLVSNRTCTPMTDVDEIKDALVYQITQGVRWRETVLAMPALGITETIEIGPGNILTGLVTRIVPEMAAKKLEI